MNYLSVSEIASIWKLSERTVRNYCANNKIPGAFITGKTWNIPADARKPARKLTATTAPKTLLSVLKAEQKDKTPGGIYHKIQVDLTYNSNHLEGSKLTHDQTRFIFETNTLGVTDNAVNVDDIIETANHFKCIDMIIIQADYLLTEKFIRLLHLTLKSGTSDSRKDWFAVGDYKRLPNEVGGNKTTAPEDVHAAVKKLLSSYNKTKTKSLKQIIDFHVRFETIHPFQDGNGRVGRLLLFKECLRNNIVPFIITDEMKMFYYRGLHEWKSEPGFLVDTCLSAQDHLKKDLDYFKIPYIE